MAKFSQKLFDTICDRIADGESLRRICQEKDMPARVNVFRWIQRSEELRNQYALARSFQAETYADEVMDIADDAANDWMKDADGEGWKLNGEHVQRSRVRIDARKWMAGKLRPKVYGDKILHGNDPDAPFEPISVVERIIVKNGDAES